MSKHTPGPWATLGTYVYKQGEDGANICTVSSPRGLKHIGHVELGIGDPDFAEAAANARLIAAAPDLLAACEVARQLASIASDWNLDEVEINGEMMSIYDVIAIFNEAVAKAREGAGE